MPTRIGSATASPGSASAGLAGGLQSALVVYGLLVAASLYAISALGDAFELDRWARLSIAAAWVIGLVLAYNRLRLPITMRRSHSLDFAVPPEAIWRTIRPRETSDFYRASVARIEQVSAKPEIYRYSLRDLCPACPLCGLPHAPNRIKMSYLSEVVEAVENCRLVTRLAGVAAGQRPVSRAEATHWQIEPHGTGSRVVYNNLAVGPMLWYWANTRFMPGNLASNILTDLKSHLEGTPSIGAFAAAREWLATARAAREHCGCAD